MVLDYDFFPGFARSVPERINAGEWCTTYLLVSVLLLLFLSILFLPFHIVLSRGTVEYRTWWCMKVNNIWERHVGQSDRTSQTWHTSNRPCHFVPNYAAKC